MTLSTHAESEALLLEDALLCADLARAAGILLPTPIERREAVFGAVLSRVEGALRDYDDDVHAALLLIRALCAADSAGAAAELGEDNAALIDQRVLSLALTDRLPAWIAELIWHLGEEVADLTDHRLVIIETLCLEWDLPRPSGPDYLFALASALGAADAAHGGEALAELLAADPGMCELIPDLMANRGVGQVLRRGNWAHAIARVCRDGLIDRQAMIDQSLAHRVGEPVQHLRWFLTLHAELDPSDEEMLARTDAYLRLLGDPRQEIFTEVLAGLQARDAQRPLPLDLIVSLTEAVFARGGDQTALEHITWLQSIAHRTPQSAARLALALTEGYVSEHEAVVEHSLDAVLAMLDVADIDAVESISHSISRAAATLPSPLAARTNRILGHGKGSGAPSASAVDGASGGRGRHSEQGPGPARKPFTIVPGPLVAPARTLPALLAVSRDFLTDLDPQLGEVVLDAIAALAGRDLAATRQALAPLLPVLDSVSAADQSPDPALWLGERPVLAVLARLMLPADHPVHTLTMRVPAGPAGVLTMRAQEVLSRATAGQVQELLSLPTRATGEIDLEALITRVADCAATGTTPWPMDVEQAMLRAHGAHIDSELITRLSRIHSPLARAVERRLRQGVLARPGIRATMVDGDAQLVATAFGDDSHGPLTRQAMDLSHLNQTPPGYAIVVLMALPHHRELAAAHLVRPLSATQSRHHMEDLRALALLGTARGRTGEATALAVLLGGSLAHEPEREAAAVALSGLAETVFDSEGWAQVWAAAIADRPTLDLTPLSTTLSAVASRPAGARLVWVLVQGVLEALGQDERPGQAALKELERSAAGLGRQPRARLAPPRQLVRASLSLL